MIDIIAVEMAIERFRSRNKAYRDKSDTELIVGMLFSVGLLESAVERYKGELVALQRNIDVVVEEILVEE